MSQTPKVRFAMCSCGAIPIHGYFEYGDARLPFRIIAKNQGKKIIDAGVSVGSFSPLEKELLLIQLNKSPLPKELPEGL